MARKDRTRVKTKKEKDKESQSAGGSITSDVAGRLGKRTDTQEFDRAIESKVALGAKGEAEKKAESEKRGIKFKPGEDLPEEQVAPKTELTDIQKGDREDLVEFTTTDELGQVKTLQVTPEQAELLKSTEVQNAAEIQARALGRTPFNELPAYQQILAGLATTGVSPGAVTKIGKLLQVGRTGRAATITNTAQNFAANGKSVASTTSWLGRLGSGLKNPTAAAGLLVGTIGTYPFAGFIKEEALQTLSFATRAARDSGDLEGEEVALNAQFEALNPTMWNKILNKIPYANVLNQLEKFYDAARVKLEIDAKSFEKRRQAITL